LVLEHPLVYVVKSAVAYGLTSYICKKYRMVLDDITIKPVSTMHMSARITSASRQPGQPVGKVLRNLSADVGQGVCTSERGASVQLWN
jgi:hypothetical protein